MKKHIFILILLVLLPGNFAAGSITLNQPKNFPQKVSFTLALEELPGFDDPGSLWEVSYDWRIADEKEYFEKSKLQDDPVIIGDVLAKSSVVLKDLKQASNRLLHIEVPVEGSVARRLRSESVNPQFFLLRANLRVYDAKIKKTIVDLIARVWSPKFYPDGNASISIKVREDGSYGIWGPQPKALPPGYKIISGNPPGSLPASETGKPKQKAASKSKKRIKTKSN